MPRLIRIGKSRSVRIPKTLIEQAGLADKALEFVVVGEGLLLRPVHRRPRQGWEQLIQQAIQIHGEESADDEWLNASLTE